MRTAAAMRRLGRGRGGCRKAKGKRQKAKGKRQKAKGKREKGKGKGPERQKRPFIDSWRPKEVTGLFAGLTHQGHSPRILSRHPYCNLRIPTECAKMFIQARSTH